MDFKYKIADVAKEFGMPAKKVVETVSGVTGEAYKTVGTFEEKELNVLLETLTRENAEDSLDAYLASGKEPAPAPKAEKKPEPKKQPAAAQQPAAKPKPAEQPKPAAKKEPKPEQKKDSRKPEKQAEKRSEKRVTLQELAADTGIKEPVKTEQVQVNRAQVSVDTRTVDVNVDKFNARYDDLADSRNMPSKRKNQPTGKKEKFNNRNNRRGQQFGRRRETEAERLQRIQLEKARNAQLKISIPDEITVGELATRLKQSAAKVVAKFMQMGEMHAISDVVDFDTAALIAEEFRAKVEHEVHVSIEERLFVQEEDNAADLVERPPVVVVMGHVDHGKTSLLDAIRKTNVTSGEAGGITQHIGAYHVKTKRGEIVFLDTPGHEAFTAMRARGAQVTDLVVLVVAADDGVMEQTREAVNHSRAAGVPIMVAVNKMDKPTANPDRVLQELASLGLVPEDWGGDTVVCKVSAKTREGLDEMLEMLALQADILELTANPDKPARGHIVEAKLDKGRGPVATVLIQEGTLHQGDTFVCGVFSGRVRAMFNDQGRKVKEAGPSIPVEVQGFEGVPEAGEEFICLEDEKLARRIAESRAVKLRERELAKQSRVTLETFLSRKADDQEALVLNLVVKSDVQGSLEAIVDALNKQSTEKVRINIIHGGTGAITESDILLASASDAIIIGFNVRPTAKVKEMAEHESVDIRFYDIIYKLVDEIKSAMAGLLAPVSREVYLGQAEVREVFSVPKVGSIAGSHVVDGKLTRNASVRLLRDGVVVHNGKIASLRRFKDDVREVLKGYECGISLENFNDIKVGDVIEAFEMVEEAATL